MKAKESLQGFEVGTYSYHAGSHFSFIDRAYDINQEESIGWAAQVVKYAPPGSTTKYRMVYVLTPNGWIHVPGDLTEGTLVSNSYETLEELMKDYEFFTAHHKNGILISMVSEHNVQI